MSENIAGVEIKAAADCYKGHLDRAGELIAPAPATTGNYQEILSRADIDAVVIATPDHWHLQMTREALAAGKHVDIEKPMTHRWEDGEAFIAAVERSGKVLRVGSQYMSMGAAQKAADFIKSGRLGQVTLVEGRFHRNTATGAWYYPIPPDASPTTVDFKSFLGSAPPRDFDLRRFFQWRLYWDYSGGLPTDLFTHLITATHQLMGVREPESVFTFADVYRWKNYREVPDQMTAMVRYDEGFVLKLTSTSGNGHPGPFLTFYGSAGTLDYPAQNDAAFRRLSLESSLRKAVERNALILHYQPQVLAREGRLIGTEALVRWNHPDLGIVYPGQFIPLAEETGLIQAIDEWVLRTACEQNAAWQRAGLPPVHVAVNLSGHEFRRVDVLERVDAIVAGAGLEPRHVELEITEGTLMEHGARTMEILNALKGRGFLIAVDDFGTGYSSLAYLKRFRADVLKIDRSFVRDVASSADDAAIVTAIVTLAHTLKMSVIAEGVENSLQRAFLHEQGCELMQGHLFGKPVPPEAIGELLRLQAAEAEVEAVALVESEAVPGD